MLPCRWKDPRPLSDEVISARILLHECAPFALSGPRRAGKSNARPAYPVQPNGIRAEAQRSSFHKRGHHSRKPCTRIGEIAPSRLRRRGARGFSGIAEDGPDCAPHAVKRLLLITRFQRGADTLSDVLLEQVTR